MKKLHKGIAFASCLIVVSLAALARMDKPQSDTNEKTIEIATDVPIEDAYCQQIELVGQTKTKETIQEEAKYFDVPLSEELQNHIFIECEKHNIAPAIIIAMIEKESQFKPDAIGDNGNSLGLLQIQPRWHQERMDRLGCNDLLDPFQNVTVGIDFVAELKASNDDLYWVLMAYNSGVGNANKMMAAGTYSEYALEVVQKAAELERMWN